MGRAKGRAEVGFKWLSKRLACGGVTRIGLLGAACVALSACASSNITSNNTQYSRRVVEEGDPVPKGGGIYKVGPAYSLNGRTYYPSENPHYRAEGMASWYGTEFHGRETANGEVYDMHAITAAHPTLPIPSYARITNLDNGRSIIVRVNDRGPYAADRLVDVSIGTAKALDFYSKGLAHVRVEYIGRAPLEGTDDKLLLATLRQGRPAPAPSLVMVAAAKPLLPESDSGREGRTGELAAAPIPPERPYGLGAARGRTPPQSAVAEDGSTKRKPVVATRSPTRAAPEDSVSAVPVSTAPVSAGFAGTGRGLY